MVRKAILIATGALLSFAVFVGAQWLYAYFDPAKAETMLRHTLEEEILSLYWHKPIDYGCEPKLLVDIFRFSDVFYSLTAIVVGLFVGGLAHGKTWPLSTLSLTPVVIPLLWTYGWYNGELIVTILYLLIIAVGSSETIYWLRTKGRKSARPQV
jgi:hypothetical protein